MSGSRIAKVEWGRLEGQRLRHAGSNARLGEHGRTIRALIARLTTEDGASGFGLSWANPEQMATLPGMELNALFSREIGVLPPGRAWESALWDLIGKRDGKPVWALTSAIAGKTPASSPSVPCYDTSLYFDDLHLDSTEDAARLLADEAREGWERGHHAFKIKVGRGARHLPLEAGTERDIAIIRAVRETVGPQATLLIDANNGYNLNLAKRVLEATADCDVFWLEEAFHEDQVLYRDLKNWMRERGIATRIADGEGDAAPNLLQWAREGLVEVIQYDIFGHGLTRWLATARDLDAWNVATAPHHYGSHLGNYVACHLAGAVQHFAFVEWDEAIMPGLDTSGYVLANGQMHVPNAPGFGIEMDEAVFRRAVNNGGGGEYAL